MPAPIALFAYRRPQHLARVIEALQANPEAGATELFAFLDAATSEEAAASVTQVRRLIETTSGFKSVKIVNRERNYGLAGNITRGISEVLAGHDSVIVVEDDILVSPYFLRFMNAALAHYRGEPRVGSISGYCYPLDRAVGETFFIRGADCWGWATWQDRWRLYDADGSALLRKLRSRRLLPAFDFDGTMAFTQMLKDQIAGRNDSWAVRWHASCFLHDLLILYPGRSLAMNIGHDGSGTHTTAVNRVFDVALSTQPVEVHDMAIEESAAGREAIRSSFFRVVARSRPYAVLPLRRSTPWASRMPCDGCAPGSWRSGPAMRRAPGRTAEPRIGECRPDDLYGASHPGGDAQCAALCGRDLSPDRGGAAA